MKPGLLTFSTPYLAPVLQVQGPSVRGLATPLRLRSDDAPRGILGIIMASGTSFDRAEELVRSPLGKDKCLDTTLS
jgi:hypothetical protein